MNTDNHAIPPMTDLLGVHWKQPRRENVLVDDTHAVMSVWDCAALPEYSRTKPSGVYPGKMWKHITRDDVLYLCWFGIVPGNDKVCSNNSRILLLTE